MAQFPRFFVMPDCDGRSLAAESEKIPQPEAAEKEHDIVDWEIGDLPLTGYLALIGQYECLLDMVVLILDKGVERAVYGIVLADLTSRGTAERLL